MDWGWGWGAGEAVNSDGKTQVEQTGVWGVDWRQGRSVDASSLKQL